MYAPGLTACLAPLKCLGEVCIIVGQGSKSCRRVGGYDISPGRDGKPAGGETVFCNATAVTIFTRGFSGCFFLCGGTRRGDINGFFSIITVIHTFFCSLLWSVMLGFRQVIQVEERTKFCLHGIFESL